MHAALVQRLLRDRSAWELAHVYDETSETVDAESAGIAATVLDEALSVHA
jgi:hypothetical protein